MSIAGMDVHRWDGCPSLGWMSIVRMDVHRWDGCPSFGWTSIARMDVHRSDGRPSFGWMSIARMDVHSSDGCPSLGWMSIARMDVHRSDGCPSLGWMSIARMDVHRSDGCPSLGWMSMARMDVHGSDGCPSLGWMSIARMDVHLTSLVPCELSFPSFIPAALVNRSVPSSLSPLTRPIPTASFCLSACLSVCLFACLSVCLFACFSVFVSNSRSALFHHILKSRFVGLQQILLNVLLPRSWSFIELCVRHVTIFCHNAGCIDPSISFIMWLQCMDHGLTGVKQAPLWKAADPAHIHPCLNLDCQYPSTSFFFALLSKVLGSFLICFGLIYSTILDWEFIKED